MAVYGPVCHLQNSVTSEVNKHLTQRGKMNDQIAVLFLSICDDSSSSSSEESDDNDDGDNELIMDVCNIITERRDILRRRICFW
jgi:hypothetical protein